MAETAAVEAPEDSLDRQPPLDQASEPDKQLVTLDDMKDWSSRSGAESDDSGSVQAMSATDEAIFFDGAGLDQLYGIDETTAARDPGSNTVEATIHTVQPGQGFVQIAESHLGQDASPEEVANYVKEIREVNELGEDHVLHPDDKLILPGQRLDGGQVIPLDNGREEIRWPDGTSANYNTDSGRGFMRLADGQYVSLRAGEGNNIEWSDDGSIKVEGESSTRSWNFNEGSLTSTSEVFKDDGRQEETRYRADGSVSYEQTTWTDGANYKAFPDGRGYLKLPDGRHVSLRDGETVERGEDGSISLVGENSTRSWKFNGERLISTSDQFEDGRQEETRYKPDGSISYERTTWADGTSFKSFPDGRGLLTLPDGKHVSLRRGEASNLTRDSRGTISVEADDGLERSWEVENGRVTSYTREHGDHTSTTEYDRDGSSTEVLRNDEGVQNTIERDSDGRITEMSYADGTSVEFTYNENNDVRTYTDREGAIWTLGHDGRYRSSRADWSSVDGMCASDSFELDIDINHRSAFLSVENKDDASTQTIDKLGNRNTSIDSMDTEEFVDVVRENWEQIDLDGDGKISDDEAGMAVADHSFTGQDALAVATLFKDFEDIADLDDKGDISFNDLDRLLSDDDVSRSVGKTIDKLEPRLERANTVLYGSADPIDSITAAAIDQGAIGNCYFMASLATLADQNPQAVQDMIRDNDNGTYTVTFPGDPDNPITVSAPTDAEMALYAGVGEHGTWPAVLEKAYGQRRDDDAIVAQEELDGGGNFANAIEDLTGDDTDREKISDYSDEELYGMLQQAMDEGLAVSVNVRDDDAPIQENHAYSILDYDAEAGTITVRNPWGENGEPPADLQDDVVRAEDIDTGDSLFVVSTEQFREWFHHIGVQGLT